MTAIPQDVGQFSEREALALMPDTGPNLAGDRDTAARVAAQNRARHGTTKAERDKIRAETARAARQLDGNRRDPE